MCGLMPATACYCLPTPQAQHVFCGSQIHMCGLSCCTEAAFRKKRVLVVGDSSLAMACAAEMAASNMNGGVVTVLLQPHGQVGGGVRGHDHGPATAARPGGWGGRGRDHGPATAAQPGMGGGRGLVRAGEGAGGWGRGGGRGREDGGWGREGGTGDRGGGLWTGVGG